MEALINGNTKVALCFCLYEYASPYRACAPALGFSLFFSHRLKFVGQTTEDALLV